MFANAPFICTLECQVRFALVIKLADLPAVTTTSALGPRELSEGFALKLGDGGVTTEYVATTTSAPPGIYTGSTCLTSCTTGTTISVSYAVQVLVSTPQTLAQTFPLAITERIELQMAPAYFNIANHQVQILNYGHLYLEYYVNGVAQTEASPLQAGRQYQGNDLLLEIEHHPELVFTDASIDSTPYVNSFGLFGAEDGYAYNQNINNVPYHGLATLNSNSWIAGIFSMMAVVRA